MLLVLLAAARAEPPEEPATAPAPTEAPAPPAEAPAAPAPEPPAADAPAPEPPAADAPAPEPPAAGAPAPEPPAAGAPAPEPPAPAEPAPAEVPEVDTAGLAIPVSPEALAPRTEVAAGPPDPLAAVGPVAASVAPADPAADLAAADLRSRAFTRRGAIEIGVGLAATSGGLALVTIQQSLAANGIDQGRARYNLEAFGGAALLVGGLATVAIGTLEIERGEAVRRGARLHLTPAGVGVSGSL